MTNSSRPARLGALAQAIQRARLSRAMSGSARRYPVLVAMASFIVPPGMRCGMLLLRGTSGDSVSTTNPAHPRAIRRPRLHRQTTFARDFPLDRVSHRVVGGRSSGSSNGYSSADESLHHSESYDLVMPPASARLTRDMVLHPLLLPFLRDKSGFSKPFCGISPFPHGTYLDEMLKTR